MGTSPELHDGGGRRTRSLFIEVAAVTGLLVVFAAVLLPTLDHPLLERHDFRQTQTAFSARIYHEDGIDLLHPRVPVFGEPFELPFEFPLYQAAASVVMDLGIAEDTALRGTTLMCFVATALLLYGLVRYVAGRIAGVAALVAFVVAPLAMVWARASTIEYLAAAGAVGFTWAFVVWRDGRRPAVWALCLAAGLVGMLVKPTTAIFWLLPALAYRPTGAKRTPLWRDPWSAVLLVFPLAAAAAWTLHADDIKKATAATRTLTSGGLSEWNFGTLGNRVDPDIWNQIGRAYGELVVSPVGLVMLVVASLALVRGRVDQRRFWVAIACAAVLPPLAFTNLYFIHEYYLAAVAPAVAALVGLGVARTATMLRGPRARITAAAVGAVLLAVWFAAGYRYWHSAYRGNATHEASVLGLAHELARVTSPSDLVAVHGLDWNPAVLYYARRRGHMVTPATEPFAFGVIHEDGYRRLLVAEPGTTDLEFTERWPWMAAVSEHVYALGDRADDLPPADFVATSSGAPGPGETLTDAPRRIACETPTPLPAGAGGTWIELAAPPESARIVTGGSLAPLPARRHVYLSPNVAVDGKVTITCSGADSLAIARVSAAAP